MASNKGQSRDGSVLFAVHQRSVNAGDPCGDGYLFHEDGGYILFAVVDGLGHGAAAHVAAEAAIASFAAHADLPLQEIVAKTHVEIRETRGVVAFIGRLDPRSCSMESVSIGNITCKIETEGERYCIATPGVLGHQIRRTIVNTVALGDGDTIYLCSDGISSRFDPKKLETDDPESRAKELFRRYRHGHDDATVMVIRLQAAKDGRTDSRRGMVSDRV
jgi:negative regulator of sigma-B (phosphoserine phosphatase)